MQLGDLFRYKSELRYDALKRCLTKNSLNGSIFMGYQCYFLDERRNTL